MTTDRDPPPERTTFCRRLQRPLPIAEHERCPYCYGETDQIREGWYDGFCTFRPGKDPINFGFPADSSRNLES